MVLVVAIATPGGRMISGNPSRTLSGTFMGWLRLGLDSSLLGSQFAPQNPYW